tara:strand:+ start:157 stop:1260 length:1104 start_codon:yes stop_codon:yes gene_type:complete
MFHLNKIANVELQLPFIGQGIGAYNWADSDWHLIRRGIDLGLTLIDTAEGYNTEEIVGKAIEGIRGHAIVATKFSPENSSYQHLIGSAEGSLKRLKTDYIDIYQMHWPNPEIPLEETMRACESLVKSGKVRYVGLSNIFLSGLKEAQSYLRNLKIATLQLEYNLFDRTVERDILPYCQSHDVYFLAYSPLDQGLLIDGNENRLLLEKLSRKYEKSVVQIILAWLISHKNVVAIPKAGDLKHLIDNANATHIKLSDEDIREINNHIRHPIDFITPNKIYVTLRGQQNRAAYQTLSEALENKLNFMPSPKSLSEDLIKADFVKPVRLAYASDGRYHLIEGRVRFWAWVIAFGFEKPIPAIIRKDWKFHE